jgi:6-phosphogluconolactonase
MGVSMAEIVKLQTAELIDKAAAIITTQKLYDAVVKKDKAVWVLAGGSTPLRVYELLAKEHKDALDWTKVYILIGDDRCVPIDSPDSNWGLIKPHIIELGIPEKNWILPNYSKDQPTAEDYNAKIDEFVKEAEGVLSIDLLWLGIGEDGHTLSLFPGRQLDYDKFVIEVLDSPKPPSERISMTLKSVSHVDNAMILATGSSKSDAVKMAINLEKRLPIVSVIDHIEIGGGKVSWLVDGAAGASI